jgi:Ca2+-binding RTX toxin-like protein
VANGVLVANLGTNSTVIAGNYVGTNADGTAALGNGGNGVTVGTNNLGGPQFTRIGTNGDGVADDLERNVISGNAGAGVRVEETDTAQTVIAGNYVGTNAAGTAAVGNAGGGVFVLGARGTRIGTDGNGTADAAEANVISGNTGAGVRLQGAVWSAGRLAIADQLIAGTLPSRTVTTTLAQADLVNAVNPAAGNWTINTPVPGGGGDDFVVRAAGTLLVTLPVGTTSAPFTFSSTTDDGSRLRIDGGDVIVADFIQGMTNRFNTAPLTLTAGPHTFEWVGFNRSGGGGYELSVAAGSGKVAPITVANGWHVVGDPNPDPTIQLQGSLAVTVYYSSAIANDQPAVVAGNFIGTNKDGTAALPNSGDGVRVEGGLVNTRVGSATGNAAEANVISGNAGTGVVVTGTGTAQTLVEGNFIGTNAAGTAAVGNGQYGVTVGSDSANSVVNNTISGNALGGVNAGTLVSLYRGVGDASDSAGVNPGTAQGSVSYASGIDGQAFQFDGTDYVQAGTVGMPAGAAERTLAAWFRVSAVPTSTTIIATYGAFNAAQQGFGLGLSNDGHFAFYSGSTFTWFFDSSNPSFNAITPNQWYYAALTLSATGTSLYLNGTFIGSLSLATTPVNTLVGGNLYVGRVPGTYGDTRAFNGLVDQVAVYNRALTSIEIQNLYAANGASVDAPNAAGAVIQGNRIGTNAAGTAAVANGGPGVRISGSAGNTVGGTTPAARNVISGNTGNGVSITGAASTGNVVQGNYVGTDKNGTVALGNASGVLLDGGAHDNVIGGTAAGAGNVISGNATNGVWVHGAANTTIQGNYIGTNAAGSAAVPNLFPGIDVDSGATGTLIGGTAAGAGNVVSGNLQHGIELDTGTSNATIQGNRIGTDATGAFAVGNGNHGSYAGVAVFGASNTLIGGTTAAARNVISGNQNDGIGLLGVGTDHTTIQGNYVGTDVNGTVAVPNGQPGIAVLDQVTNTTIGGTAAGAGNVVSGNSGGGILVSNYFGNGAPTGTVIQGNRIGTAAGGSAALPNTVNTTFDGFGVKLDKVANTTVGGTASGAGNLISGNAGPGVEITGAASTGDVVAGNFIGTDAAGTMGLGNSGIGLLISGGASNNTVGGTTAAAGNVVAYNLGGGVLVSDASSTGNAVRFNQLYGNSVSNLKLSGGANDGLINPVLSAVFTSGVTHVTGSFNSLANTTFTLDFYSAHVVMFPALAEARTPVGSATVVTDASGHATFDFVFNVAVPAGDSVTATATRQVAGPGIPATLVDGSTSELSSLAVAVDSTPTITNDVPTSGDEGTAITLVSRARSADPNALFTFAWTVTKDGQPFATGDTASFAFTPDDNGSYAVSLVVNDGVGNVRTYNQFTPVNPIVPITVHNVAPTVQIDTPPLTAPGASPLHLTSTVTDPGAADTAAGFTYVWSVSSSNGQAVANGTGAAFDFTPSDAGTYVVTLTVKDKDLAVGSDVASIEVTPAPRTVTLATTVNGQPPASVFEGDPVVVTAALSPPAPDGVNFTYAWTVTKNGNPYATSGDIDFAFTPDDNGSYAVHLDLTDANGFPVGSASQTLTVLNVAPTATITPDANNPSTASMVYLAASVSDPGAADTAAGFTYTWFVTRDNAPFDLPAGTATDQPTFSFAPTGGGTFVVMLTVTDKDGAVSNTDRAQIVLGTAGADDFTFDPNSTDTGATQVVVAPGATSVVIDAMGGNDTVDASNAPVPVVLDGGAGNDSLTGSDMGDLIIAGPGQNTVIGGAGNDTLMGGDNNDYLEGDAGNDTFGLDFNSAELVDNSGTNTIDLSAVSFGITLDTTINAGQWQQVNANGSKLSLTGQFQDIVGTGFKDDLTGGSGSNLFGGAGDDNLTATANSVGASLFGGDGNDTLIAMQNSVDASLFGGDGADVMQAMATSDGASLFGGDGADVMTADVGALHASLFGGDGADVMTAMANSLDASLFGGTGDDVMTADVGAINAVLSGDDGSDTLKATGGNDGASLFGGDGSDTLIADEGALHPSLFGGAGDDNVEALSGAVDPSLFGGDGNDTMVAAGALDASLFGGAGDDMLSVSSLVVNASLFGGTGSDGTLPQIDGAQLISIAGSDNALVELDGASLFGGDGSDTLTATGVLHASLFGGAGDDMLSVSSLVVNASLFGGTGSDHQTLTADGSSLFGGDGNDTLLAENALRPCLFGGTGNDELQALNGSDDATLFGGDGNDTLLADNSLRPCLFGGAGNDELTAQDNADLASLFGGTGNDELQALNGSDDATLFGGDGNDTLVAQNVLRPSLFGGAGNDDVQALGTTDAASLFGGTGDDTLRTNATGKVTLLGEEGDDTYVFGTTVSGTVTLDEVRKLSSTTAYNDDASLGNDTLDFSALNGITVDLGVDNSEGTQLPQAVAPGVTLYLFGDFENVIGSPGNDTITGNAADNLLLGGGGNDSVVGGAGNDTLDGGAGDNTLVGNDSAGGGGGHDVYRFTDTTAGTDTIVAPDGDRGTLDFSALTSGVTVNLGSTTPQAVGAARSFTLSSPTGVTGVIGTASADAITGNAAGDVFAGGGGNDSVTGGGGNDLYKLVPNGAIHLTDAAGIDTIDFSTANYGVTVSLGLNAGQTQALDVAGNTLALTGTFENLIGSRFDDRLTGNAAANQIYGRSGRDVIDGGPGGGDRLQGSITQVVLLDFDSYTKLQDHQYTKAERDAIQARLAVIYGSFPVEFTQDPVKARNDSLGEGGQYVTLFFNKLPPGGKSDEIDWGNLNLGGTASINVNYFLGGNGQLPLDSDGDLNNGIDSNVVAMSAEIAAHEFGHLNGLLHGDSQGSIGDGPFVDPSRYLPIYVGPSGGAQETHRHVMASPAGVGTTLADAVGETYFGEREAIKLAFDDAGVVVNEQAGAHGTLAGAQVLGDLPGLTVPNTLRPGDANYGKVFAVRALDVVGAIKIDPATGKSENDWYALTGRAGDVFNAEVYSSTLNRAKNSIDSVLRLYDSDGNLVFENDDGIETTDSSLLDVKLPKDGTFYVEVDTFTPNGVVDFDTGSYELFMSTFTPGGGTQALGQGDTIIAGSASDTVVGSTGNDVYDLTMDEGSLLTFTATGLDPGLAIGSGGPLTYSLSGAPAGASIDAATGRFTWTPADNGAATITITVTDSAGMSATQSFHVTVNNVAPSGLALTQTATQIDENGTVSVGGSFTDPGAADTHTVTITWGDGSPDTVIPLGAGVLSFPATGHQYLDNKPGDAPYTISVSVTDKDDAVNAATASTSVTVKNTPPSAAITGAPATSPEGTAITLGSTASDKGSLDQAAGLTYSWSVTKNGNPYASGSGAGFTFTPDDNGAFAVTLTVTDKDGGVGTDTQTVTVTNVPPTLDSIADQTVNEGTPVNFSTAAHDVGPLDAPSVSWHVVSSNGQLISDGTGTAFGFTPNDNGTYTLTVTATDKDGASTSRTVLLMVNNVTPSGLALTQTATQIDENGTVSVGGSFTDPGAADTHTVTITWGDGSPDTVIALGAGVLSIPATSHQYLDNKPGDAPYSISVTVTDKDGGVGTAPGTSVTVRNVTPSNVSVGVSATPINENGTTTLSGSFQDVGTKDTHNVNITWGDGSTQTVGLAAGVLTFSGVQHQYLDNPSGGSAYTVSVTVTDKDGATSTAGTASVTVNNVAPTPAIAGVLANNPEGTAINLTGSATDDSSVDQAAGFTFAWTVKKNGSAFASGTGTAIGFTPDDNGSYAVSLTATDKDGGSGTTALTINVSNAAPTLTVSGPASAVAAQVLTYVLNPSEPSSADRAAGFTYVVNWGDGTAAQTVTGPAGTTVTHVFAATGPYTVTATATDKDGGTSVAATASVAVNAVTFANLQQQLTLGGTVTFVATTAQQAADVIAAVNGLPAQNPPVTVVLDLGSGTSYTDLALSPKAGVTLVINGNGSQTVVGNSPALTVGSGTGSSGNVVISGVTFTTATDAPTILVAGGHLTLRHDVIQESTGINVNQVAVQVTGGTVDLGTDADSGGNTLNVNGPGAFIRNATSTPVPAVGDTFTVNGLSTSGSLSGVVWEDFNNDGQVDFGEAGLRGVTVRLTGTDDLGNAVSLTQTTDADGAYVFRDLRPGNYKVTEAQPAGYLQGIDSVGTAGGILSATDQFSVTLGAGVSGLNYNFGEQPASTGSVKKGQAAGIGFWNNKNGQALIKSLNGGAGHQLADWLAATLPNTFGIHAGANNLTGKSNADIAALFQQDFVMKGVKLDAQVLATALSVYATNATLDSTQVAAQYGFTVSGDGLGAASVNVGTDGDAFGVANNTMMRVIDVLIATDARAVNGVLYGGDTTKRSHANDVYSAINQAGGL